MSSQGGHRWRSSQTLRSIGIIGALFLNTFEYSFIVPIINEIFECRLHIDPSKTQANVSGILAIHGLTALFSAPIIGHFADQTAKKKLALLVSVSGYIPGTLLIAWSPALWAVYIGRVIQALSGTGVWIVGFAALTQLANASKLGSLMGVTMSFITGGIIIGPLAGGTFLSLLGYWPAWIVTLAMISLDVLILCAMILPNETTHDEESEPLLAESHSQNDEVSDWIFYRTILTDSRALVCLAVAFVLSLIMSSFDTTLPLHVRDAFSFGAMTIGQMFALLQLPALLLNPLAGKLRDKVGLRWPTVMGFALLTPLLLLLGSPGFFDWASPNAAGKLIFMISLALIGAATSLIVSVAPIGLTEILAEYEAENPYIFGAKGGASKIFSTEESAWTGGLLVGPLLSGFLNETIGYFWMNLFLASTSFLLALAVAIFLVPTQKQVPDVPAETVVSNKDTLKPQTRS